MSLSRFSVQNPVAVNLLMMGIVIGGAYCWIHLVRELFPTTATEAISISVPYPGASPDEVEELVARRVEIELKDLDGVKKTVSRVLEGLSITDLELHEGADRDRLLNDVRSRVDRLKPDLPEAAEDPVVTERRPRLPVIGVVVHGAVEEAPLREAARQVREDLLDLPGVSEVFASGLRARELWVELDPLRLEAYGLTFAEVGQAVAATNLDLAGGQLKGAQGYIRVRTLGKEDRAVAVEDLIVRARPDGSTVRLRDLGRVIDTFADDPERGRFAGRPSVLITVFKTPEQDAIDIATKVKRYVADHPSLCGGAVRLDVTNDLSRFIEQRLDLMIRNARSGLLLVLVALALFLDLKVAFWVACGIPVSFLGTFLAMSALGATINMISLFGLIIVLGLIVDDAIVIGENVFAKLRAGLSPIQAAIEGADEVALPVVAAVLTTIAAFLPLGFIEGRMGAFLGVLPVVVICALGVSLIEAFIILPAHLGHAKVVEPRGRLGLLAARLQAARNRILEEVLPDLLERQLRVVLRWRYLTLAAAVALMVACVGLIVGGQVPFVLLQEVDAETLSVELEMAAGTPEERTAEVLRDIEQLALGLTETHSVFSVLGTSFGAEGRASPADPAVVGQVVIDLQPADEREARGLRTSKEILALLRAAAAGYTGVSKLTFAGRSGGPEGADIEVQVRGDDLARIGEAVEVVERELRGFTGVYEVRSDLAAGKLEARLRLRPQAHALGLTTQRVAVDLRSAFFGLEAQELQVKDERVTVRVLLPRESRQGLADLERLRIATPGGGRVPLGEACELTLERGYAALVRVDGKRAVTVRAEVDDDLANTSEVTAALGERLAAAGLAERLGVETTFEGRKQETQESLGSLAVGFPAALLMIYALIAIVFRSYVQPLIVMTAIPFSIVGAILGHLVMGYPVTLLSMIGMVALAGVVVNDSLILVDFINRARVQGRSVRESAIEGARTRMRAILLTSATTVAGLFPLLLERSFQAQFLIPMAISIVFGLAFATAIVLFLVPTIYMLLEDALATLRWAWTGRWQ